MNIIKKIESSEMTKKTLSTFRHAIERLNFIGSIAYVHMGKVDDTDILMIIADFFMRLSEAAWSVVSGVYHNKLIIIFRNATIQGDAENMAKELFGQWAGSVGGHMSAARAEISLSMIRSEIGSRSDLAHFVKKQLKGII
jgi:hypothetical protein